MLMTEFQMYTCSPNEVCHFFLQLLRCFHLYFHQDTFSVYASDAVFHDPIGIATGPKTIQAQFIALAKVCSAFKGGCRF